MRSAEQVLVLITRALINRSNIVNLQLVIISHPATATSTTSMTTIARATPRRSSPVLAQSAKAVYPYRYRCPFIQNLRTDPCSGVDSYEAGLN